MAKPEIPSLDKVKVRILEYCRKINLGKRHHLFQQNIQEMHLSLNAGEKPLLEAGLKSLTEDGVFRACRGENGQELELTDDGFCALYPAPEKDNEENK